MNQAVLLKLRLKNAGLSQVIPTARRRQLPAASAAATHLIVNSTIDREQNDTGAALMQLTSASLAFQWFGVSLQNHFAVICSV